MSARHTLVWPWLIFVQPFSLMYHDSLSDRGRYMQVYIISKRSHFHLLN